MPTPENTHCPTCGHLGLELRPGLRARPLGSHSLAGSQMKVSARTVLRWHCTSADCDASGPAQV